MTRRIVLLTAMALLANLASRAQSRPVLHQVHRIRVAAMGSGTDSDRFHDLLQDELRKTGFEIGDSGADAEMSGEFSFEKRGDFSSAHANLQLKSQDGKRTLWSGDYVSQHKGTTTEDVVKTLAQTCAERFHRDWAKN